MHALVLKKNKALRLIKSNEDNETFIFKLVDLITAVMILSCFFVFLSRPDRGFSDHSF